MENISSLFSHMEMENDSNEIGGVSPGIDIVGCLPPEISSLILRRLDAASLAAAARVSRRWLRLCRGDRVLRLRVLRQLRDEARGVLRALQVAPAAPGPQPGPAHDQPAAPAQETERENAPTAGRVGSRIDPSLLPSTSSSRAEGPPSAGPAEQRRRGPKRQSTEERSEGDTKKGLRL